MKRKIKENLLCFIYIFIIFTSMYPNHTNSNNIAKFNTIIPGIENVYNSNKNEKGNKYKKETNYSFKSIEIIKIILNK